MSAGQSKSTIDAECAKGYAAKSAGRKNEGASVSLQRVQAEMRQREVCDSAEQEIGKADRS